ncbi:ABC-type transport auxiliary lipoprotein family protein [Vibrio sp. 1CM23M]|uniref:PqiC family protein n=1 Tax=Vibrio sp. 1CM23M TaxID=2929164 RepID=UPI0020BE428D|nr:ABC-type transport auxiliary lipoprotein family protein [Vibrio sp. 1CM23M]MCK8071551.1 ABC-type transport auxiliary lipoprotein family protein [Vibrio sp. 1CM23M]
MRKLFISLIALLGLLGCSTPTDGTNAYLLPESTLDKPIFKVKTRVELPDYLDTIGIAYRKSENELISARKHVWAENLEGLLEERVNSSNAAGAEDKELTLIFEQFNGSYTGNAEVKGSWVLSDQDTVLARADFESKVPLKEAGYEALVEALGEGLDKVLSEIQTQLP